MTNVLADIYNACNPLEPAKPEYYVDCSAVRGSDAFATQYQHELSLANGFLTRLFSGHIGCGKSSELEHVAKILRHPNSNPSVKRYFPIILNAGEYLDDYDVTPTDILLAIVGEIGDAFSEKFGIKLKDNIVSRRLDEIKEYLLSDIEINEGEIPISEAKIKIQRLKKDATARQLVRAKLLPQMSSLQEEINVVFAEARIKLKGAKVPAGERPYDDFVLIVDDLEKIQRISGTEEGARSHHELFINRSPQLTGLKAHVIFTIPLALVRSNGPELHLIYGKQPFVLPMIKVASRTGDVIFEEGRQKLTEILQKRAGNTPLDEVIQPDAVNRLIRYSGGHVRNLMTFVQSAATYVAAAPITVPAAQRALNQSVGLLSTSIRTNWWRELAILDRSPEHRIDNNEADMRQMLEQIIIMEYLNGPDDHDPFSSAAPWYGVNPIVRELPQFKSAIAALDPAPQTT